MCPSFPVNEHVLLSPCNQKITGSISGRNMNCWAAFKIISTVFSNINIYSMQNNSKTRLIYLAKEPWVISLSWGRTISFIKISHAYSCVYKKHPLCFSRVREIVVSTISRMIFFFFFN